MLDWTRYPYGPNSSTPGWVEESFTNFEKGINWRSYVVCDVSYANVNNWLWTPFITRHDANRIHIEIKFSLRNCDLFPGNAVKCKETFSLLYYEFDAATREPPPWEPESYKLIDRIAADEGRFTDTNEVIINTETRSIDVTKKGVYFAFRDQGACLSLLAVKVYYLTCPEITVGFAHYPETATGAEVSSIEKVLGKCTDHSVAVSQPSYLCKGDGSWIYNTGQCACMAGYEADEASQTCEACPVGRFKHTSGDGPCLICPPHSQALYAGSVECRCNDGYYRAPSDSRTSACTRPPSAPRNVTYRFIDKTTLQLSWNPPRDEGARSDTNYEVDMELSSCPSCATSVTFNPSEETTWATMAISNLSPGMIYKLRVYASNGVSSLAGINHRKNANNYAEIIISGDHDQIGNSAHLVTSVSIEKAHSSSNPNAVFLSWQPPTDPTLDVDVYEVKHFERGKKKNTSQTVITEKDTAEIKGLKENIEYGFQVRTKSANGDWGDFNSPIFWSSSDKTPASNPIPDRTSINENDGVQVRVAVGVIVAVILLLLIAGILLFAVKRNNGMASNWMKSKQGNLQSSEKDCCDSLDYRGLDAHFTNGGESLPIVQTHTNSLVPPSHPIYNPFSSHKTYVDPHTYEDPHIAVRQFAKEIDSRYITIEAIIGGGEFGDVCRGRLSLPDRSSSSSADLLVAIKTLKPGSSDKARMDFLTEASIMGQFEHPNVIFLQGVVTKAQPTMIITEYMENGSLDTFLRANDGKFQVMQLVGMMRGIAYGMQYLAEMNYVHRDLAARNVLVNSQLVCKIADFGLSREISGDGNVDGAYTTRGGKIPVRWTAPEAIHQLMLDCWQKERSHRPSFVSIVKTLDKLICCPETLKKIANSPVHNPFGANVPDYSAYTSVSDWLASIKMSRYVDNFSHHNITSIDAVAKLSLQQLVDMGITLVGHQKKIMGSIHAMRAQLSVNMSEGFLV